MRRMGGLYDRIADRDNLLLAVLKARRGKRGRQDAISFEQNQDDELNQMVNELRTGTVNWRPYHVFTVFDPKERRIYAPAFRDRVLQHAVMNVCHEAFDACQSPDSHASRLGKGLYTALDQVLSLTRRFPYVLKMDVRRFFDSIDHGVVLAMLRRRFNESPLVNLFAGCLATYCTAPGKGLPIGTLFSQYLANHYLAGWDHHVRSELKVKGYVRYMDDFLIFGQSRVELGERYHQASAFLVERLGLAVKPKTIPATAGGFCFLGYRLTPRGLELSPASRKRFRHKMSLCQRLWWDQVWDDAKAAEHALPLIAFARHGCMSLDALCQVSADQQANDRTTQPFSKPRVTGQGRLQPRQPRWLLEQQGAELPGSESQQEYPGQPQHQPGLPPGRSLFSLRGGYPEKRGNETGRSSSRCYEVYSHERVKPTLPPQGGTRVETRPLWRGPYSNVTKTRSS